MAKTAADENFPVGSWLIARRLRPLVHLFYRFARAADDVADHPSMPLSDKLSRLDEMGRGALHLPLPLRTYALDLLQAFGRDARNEPVEDWDGLMAYCRLSAIPVGRMLLALHDEDEALIPASDALCAALQVINHMQDCGSDARLLGRVYIPGAGLEELRQSRSSPSVRAALDAVIERCRDLLGQARELKALRSWRLRAEAKVILSLAQALLWELSCKDPLAGPVRLSRFTKDWAVIRGLLS
jgi:phytoene/squalene synthetase